jgi:hypothetical protein
VPHPRRFVFWILSQQDPRERRRPRPRAIDFTDYRQPNHFRLSRALHPHDQDAVISFQINSDMITVVIDA